MIAPADSRLGRCVAVMAVMLMTMLVVQTPIATVDRLLHDTGRAHAANALVGAIVDLPEHEHAGDHHDQTIAINHDGHDGHDDALAEQTVGDEPSSDPAARGLHHHHHDGPSVFSLAETLSLAVASSSSPLPFRSEDDLRKGGDAFLQDRPPKLPLAHVA